MRGKLSELGVSAFEQVIQPVGKVTVKPQAIPGNRPLVEDLLSVCREWLILADTQLPPWKQSRENFRRALVERAIACANGNLAEAARLLHVKRTTLIEMLQRWKHSSYCV